MDTSSGEDGLVTAGCDSHEIEIIVPATADRPTMLELGLEHHGRKR